MRALINFCMAAFCISALAFSSCATRAHKTTQKDNHSETQPTRQLPKVIAHRGYWKTEGSAQNSVASFCKAAEIGCYGSELDVFMTSDGVIVSNHDRNYKNVPMETSASDKVLALTLDNGENLPRLEAVLDKMAAYPDIRMILEIKTPKDKKRIPAQAAIVTEMVRSRGLMERMDLIAFSKTVCLEYIRQMPGVKVFYLNGDLTPAELKAQGYGGLDYKYSVLKDRPEWVAQAHDLGLEVNVWTVNSEADMRYFIDLGVDYITTDEPLLLQSVLRTYEK